MHRLSRRAIVGGVKDDTDASTSTDTNDDTEPAPTIGRGLVLLLAVTCGVLVANLYYAQPLLHSIARSFDVDNATAGILVTTAQIGYAVGLAFLVPLGDMSGVTFSQRRNGSCCWR